MGNLTVRDLVVELPKRRLLDRVDFAVEAGECIAIVGPSGSGKTSLLNCLAGILTPGSGSIRLDEIAVTELSMSKRTEFRLRHVGMIFQFGELLPELTAIENVALPLRLMGTSRNKAERRAAEWLECVGINSELARDFPETLSGGEVQRVAIARALAHEPRLVLADEPTGALDEVNTRQIIKLLVSSAKELGAVVVITTHDPLAASRADRVLRLHEGRLSRTEEFEEIESDQS